MSKARSDPNREMDGATLVQMARSARALNIIQEGMEWDNMDGVKITKISIKQGREGQSKYLAVINLRDAQQRPYVAFVGGESLTEVAAGIASRMEGEGLKMREDRPLT